MRVEGVAFADVAVCSCIYGGCFGHLVAGVGHCPCKLCAEGCRAFDGQELGEVAAGEVKFIDDYSVERGGVFGAQRVILLPVP